MSRSNPPSSNTESTKLNQPLHLPASNGASGTIRLQPIQHRPHKKSLSTQFAATVRWLHIYISLLGFTAMVFFAITGITLNHPSWFGVNADRVVEHQGELPLKWLERPSSDAAPSGDEVDHLRQVGRLEIVEQLRATHSLRGAVAEFRADEYECMVVFKGPGYSADTFINRETGKYTLTETVMGTVAVINDLHKGRDSGWIWSLVIDATALLTVVVSLTGLVLIFYIKRKRWSGIITAVVGTIALVVVYAIWVP
ncbi:MAG TPA: PepSY-associated TM helix domain-containing protein [Pirellulaceae bacterium]|nr:PepSY-associated TM helix domain-containing protein [Pirellulaceae bacterium]